MTTSTITKQDQMVDVIISDGKMGYDELIPADIAADKAIISDGDKPLLRAWLDDWMADYSYLTEDEDEHTATVRLDVIDTDTREVLFVGDFVVATTQM